MSMTRKVKPRRKVMECDFGRSNDIMYLSIIQNSALDLHKKCK